MGQALEGMPRDKKQAPKVCPNCKSPYWDRPRQAESHARAAAKRKRRPESPR
jgi:hypothetical protein